MSCMLLAPFISANGLDEIFHLHGTLLKLLNDVFRVRTFYIEVALKYHINLFFKFRIIKTQLIIC